MTAGLWLACVQYIAGQLAQADLCSVYCRMAFPAGLCSVYCRMAGPGWIVFSILQDGWPRLACIQYIAGWLAQAGLYSVYCRMAGLGWLVFSSIVGQLA